MVDRREVKNWLFTHPTPLVESCSKWEDQQKALGVNNEIRKQGDEHSLCGLPGVFTTRIHVIIIRTLGHRIMEYNSSRKHSAWRGTMVDLLGPWKYPPLPVHYKVPENCSVTTPSIPPPTTRVARGNSERTRRATGSTEPINDPDPVVWCTSRITDSIPPDQITDLIPSIPPVQKPERISGYFTIFTPYTGRYFCKYIFNTYMTTLYIP